MKFENLPDTFEKWLKSILLSNKCHIDILWVLKTDVKEVEPWIKSLRENDNKYEILPINKTLGLFSIPEEFVPNFKEGIIPYFKEKIETSEFKIPGIINYISLIERIGNFYQEEIDTYVSELIKLIPKEIFRETLEELAKSLNNLPWFENKSISTTPTSIKEWEYLIQTIKYISSSSPSEILVRFFQNSQDENVCFDTFIKLVPVVKAFILYFDGWDLKKNVSSEKLLLSLQNGQIEPELLTLLILYPNDLNYDKEFWIPENIIKELIINNWAESGKKIFINAFNSIKPIHKLSDIVHKSLLNIFDKKEEKIIFGDLKWSKDYETLAGWFDYLNNNKIDFNYDQITKSMNDSWINFFKFLSNKLDCLTLDEDHLSIDLTLNIFDKNYQLALGFSLWFILNSQKEQWDEWKRDLKTVIIKLKVLYYSSYNINYQSARISEFILLFSLSFANFDEKEFTEDANKRIMEIFSVINLILFPYVHFVEKEEIIWNKDKFQPGPHTDKGLFLVNQYIRAIKSNNTKKGIIKDFLDNWEKNTTTIWPWMRNE